MGFSLIAAAAILGVTLFMAVEIIVSDLLPTIEEMNTAYVEMKDRVNEQIQTGISITGVSRTLNGTIFEYTLSVENTGSITLCTNDFVILINGSKCDFSCSYDYLYPANNASFVVSNQIGDGLKRMKVITNNGIEDYYTYSP
jgi:archaellum component FlaF (FlaF/FlaG flagellin family)